MRMPREVSGEELAKRLARFGYRVERRTEAHLYLRTLAGGPHELTLPRGPLAAGTLESLLEDLEAHHGLNQTLLLKLLFD